MIICTDGRALNQPDSVGSGDTTACNAGRSDRPPSTHCVLGRYPAPWPTPAADAGAARLRGHRDESRWKRRDIPLTAGGKFRAIVPLPEEWAPWTRCARRSARNGGCMEIVDIAGGLPCRRIATTRGEPRRRSAGPRAEVGGDALGYIVPPSARSASSP
jgi:hypothetical protein